MNEANYQKIMQINDYDGPLTRTKQLPSRPNEGRSVLFLTKLDNDDYIIGVSNQFSGMFNGHTIATFENCNRRIADKLFDLITSDMLD